MAIAASKKLSKSALVNLTRVSLFHSIPSSLQALEESIRSAIESKNYDQIPNLLVGNITTAQPHKNPNRNPFFFLSSFSQSHRTQIIDEILQSLIPLRPRSLPQIVYSYLLSHSLQNPNPLPLAFAILQRTLRSGCVPIPQTHLSLTSAWMDRRRSDSVTHILSEMRSIGYRPDRGTCNYLLSSLCAVDQLDESVRVLKEMGRVGCDPDSESYEIVIGSTCGARKTDEAAKLLREMVGDGIGIRLMPRQGTVAKMVAAMRANREVRLAVEMVEFLERNGFRVGFEGYEMVVEGCLERGELVLAGKVVLDMVERGFIPYIRVRQRLVEGLARVGEGEFACVLRQKFAGLRS